MLIDVYYPCTKCNRANYYTNYKYNIIAKTNRRQKARVCDVRVMWVGRGECATAVCDVCDSMFVGVGCLSMCGAVNFGMFSVSVCVCSSILCVILSR